MKHRTMIGALGIAGAATLALAPSAFAHPNLQVATKVSCSGINYGVSGIDQGTSVSVTLTRIVNGQKTTETVGWPSTQQGKTWPVAPGFQGSILSSITSEGKTASDYQTLACRQPVPPPIPPKPPELVPPPPPPTCAELFRLYPKAGPVRVREWQNITGEVCTPPKPPLPPPDRPPRVCAKPTTLRIVQQQTGTFYLNTYPLRVRIRNMTGARTPAGALVLTDSGLQNFVAPDGSRTERLVVPVGPMRRGQTRVVNRTMGFVGVEAFKEVFTTYATFHVQGRVCGYALDRAFEG